MSLNYTPVQPGKHARVWLALNGVGPDKEMVLEGYIVPDQVTMNQTVDVVTKKIPSATRRGQFEVAYKVTQRSDPEISTSLINRMPADMRSMFLKLVQSGCKFDMVWAYGVCTEPDRYNEFDKLEVFEGVSASNYSHDQVGAFDDSTLADDVLENVELTIDHYYDYAKPDFRTAVTPSNDLYDLLIGDVPGCGSSDGCTETLRSDGARRLFVAEGVSGTPADITLHFSIDGGVTWSQETLTGVDQGGAALGYVSGNIVVFEGLTAGGDLAYRYAPVNDFDTGADPTWTVVGTAASWTDMVSVVAEGATYVAVGTDIYEITASNLDNGGSLVTSSGPATPVAGDAMGGRVVFVSTSAGAIIDDGVYTGAVTSVPAGTNGIHIKSENEWLFFAGTGVYLTKNGGESEAQVSTLAAAGYEAKFATQAVGYVNTASGVYATADGGNTWYAAKTGTDGSGGFRVEASDNGNFVMLFDGTNVIIGEDRLRRVYGSF